MAVGAKIVGFIRSVFSRDHKELQDAAGAATVNDLKYNIDGNYAMGVMGYTSITDQLQVDNALMSRYVDYERMDEYSECSAALDIYSDDSTVMDSQMRHVLWTECEDGTIQEDLDNMFWNKVKVDSEAWESVRMLVKYGSCAEEILVNDNGVQGLNFLPAPSVRRLEDKSNACVGYVQSFKGFFNIPTQAFGELKFDKGVGKDQSTGVVLFEPWRIAFMRLRSTRRRAMYGLGILESARWIWKRLVLLEDAALISRLSRAPSRFAFYIDVGRMSPEDAEKYLHAMSQRFKKNKFVDPRSGKLNLRYNPLSSDEDLYLPVRDSKEVVRADVLNTPTWTGVEDIEYFRAKLFAALKVPKAYLGYDENMPSRATLSAEDVRFGRAVLRVQNEYRSGMRHVAQVHLAARGIDPAYVDFHIKMAVPSSIFELAQLEVQNTRSQFAQSMEMFVSKHWILSKVFGMSDQEIEKIFEQRKQEQGAEMGGGGRFESVAAPGNPGGTAAISVPNRPVRYQLRPSRQPGSDLEKQLFSGNREHEKRLEHELGRLLSEQRVIGQQVAQTRGFMTELRSAMRSARNVPSV